MYLRERSREGILPDNCKFPQDGIVWELNYRGTLEFLHQAEAQKEAEKQDNDKSSITITLEGGLSDYAK